MKIRFITLIGLLSLFLLLLTGCTTQAELHEDASLSDSVLSTDTDLSEYVDAEDLDYYNKTIEEIIADKYLEDNLITSDSVETMNQADSDLTGNFDKEVSCQAKLESGGNLIYILQFDYIQDAKDFAEDYEENEFNISDIYRAGNMLLLLPNTSNKFTLYTTFYDEVQDRVRFNANLNDKKEEEEKKKLEAESAATSSVEEPIDHGAAFLAFKEYGKSLYPFGF